MRFILSLLALTTLAACSLLPKPEQEIRYTLAPVSSMQPGSSGATTADPSRTIRVMRPEVPLAYRGSQLVLVKNGEQTFYAGKAWEAPVPDLLDAALTRDLATNLPGWVISNDTSGVRSAYELQTDVRTFATIQQGTQTDVVMDIDIRLVSPADRKILKILPYHFRATLSPFTTQATVSAFNQGWQALITQITGMLSPAN